MAEISNNTVTPQTQSPGAGVSAPAPTAVNQSAQPNTANVKGPASAPVATGKPGETAAVQPPKEERISPKLQALVTREKQALAREQAAKSREAQATAKETALAEREARITQFESLKDTNPKKALEMLGLTYQDLTLVEMNDGALTPELHIKKLEEKFDTLTKKQQDEAVAAAEQAKKQAQQDEQQATDNFQKRIGSFCETNAKEYEFIRFEGQQQLVFDVIQAHYQRTYDEKTGVGKIMEIKEAADRVEAYLEKRYEKLASLEKFQNKFSAQPGKAPGAKPQTNPGQKQKTMTNEMSATPTRTNKGPLTDDERIAKAIAYAKGLGRG